MNKEINFFIKNLNQTHPATEEQIFDCEKILNLKLPTDYKEYLKITNGSEGFIQESYVIFWAVDEVPILNRSYEVNEYAPGLVLFGSNGGGEAFAFDTRDKLKIVQIPFIGMDLEDVEIIANTFLDFLKFLYESR
jgi:hypothetical protein